MQPFLSYTVLHGVHLDDGGDYIIVRNENAFRCSRCSRCAARVAKERYLHFCLAGWPPNWLLWREALTSGSQFWRCFEPWFGWSVASSSKKICWRGIPTISAAFIAGDNSEAQVKSAFAPAERSWEVSSSAVFMALTRVTMLFRRCTAHATERVPIWQNRPL